MIDRLDDYMRFQTEALKLRSQRQELLAANIANADTPGYKAHDLKPFAAAMRSTAAYGMTTTDPAHLTASAHATTFSENPRVKGWETTPSGNNVLLEEEMIKAAESSREYDLASTLMRKHLTMMRATLNTRG